MELYEENGMKVVNKEDSLLMKIFGVLSIFNPDFMKYTTTTLFSTVYMPKKIRERGNHWKILLHEFVHMWDSRRDKLYLFKYAFPQILGFVGFLALLAVWFTNWWLVALVFLILLAPIPSPGRTSIEKRGYAMTMACNYWRHKNIGNFTREDVVTQFIGWRYYKMWPFKQQIKEWVDTIEGHLKEHNLPFPNDPNESVRPYIYARNIIDCVLTT